MYGHELRFISSILMVTFSFLYLSPKLDERAKLLKIKTAEDKAQRFLRDSTSSGLQGSRNGRAFDNKEDSQFSIFTDDIRHNGHNYDYNTDQKYSEK